MTGNRHTVILQQRDYHLLSEIAVMRILDREQAKIVAPFNSTTRANARLLALLRAGLLNRLFLGTSRGGAKALYTLSAYGARVCHVKQGISRKNGLIFSSDSFFQHQSRLNALYVELKYRPLPIPGWKLRQYRTFHQPVASTVPLVPDGYFEIECPGQIICMFLEVDLETEGIKVWQRKTDLYLQLAVSGEFTQIFQQPRFRVLVVAKSERRCHAIAKAVSLKTDKLFFFSTFEFINRDGFWSPVWLRPAGNQMTALV